MDRLDERAECVAEAVKELRRATVAISDLRSEMKRYRSACSVYEPAEWPDQNGIGGITGTDYCFRDHTVKHLDWCDECRSHATEIGTWADRYEAARARRTKALARIQRAGKKLLEEKHGQTG